MSLPPINPIRTYTLDYELTFKFFKYFLERNKLLAPDQLEAATGPMIPVQLGLYTGKGKVKHIDLKGLKSQIPALSTQFYDRERKARSGTIKVQSMSDLDEFFDSSSVLKGENLEKYKKKVGFNYISPAETVVNRGDFVTSKWSDDKFFKDPVDAINDAIKRSKGMKYSQKDFSEFIHGTGDDSIHKIISDLMKGSSPQRPAVMQAWNASIEINTTASLLSAGGHTDLLNEMMQNYHSGALKVKGMEEEWQKVAYGLTKEHQSSFNNLTIHWNPEAAKVTGRPGGKVTSFDDFKYSTMPWNQELVGGLFGLDEQLHFAGPDVEFALKIDKVLKDIQQKAIEKASTAGNKIESFDDLLKLTSQDNFVSQAMDEVLGGINGQYKSSDEVVNKLTRVVNSVFDARSNFRQAFFGAELLSAKKPKLWQYAGAITTASLLLGSTYLASNKDYEEEDFDNKIATNSNFPLSSMIDRSEEDHENDPSKPGSFTKEVLLPLVGTTTFFGAVGYGAYKRTPLGFRYKPPQINNIQDAIKTAANTTVYGIRSIEASLPPFRVFQLSNIYDTIFGSHKYSVDEATKSGRYYSFDVIKDNRILGRANEALGNLDQFIKAASEAHPEDAEWLKDTLRPKNAGSTDRRIIKLARAKNGKTVLFYEELSLDVNKVGEVDEAAKKPKVFNVDIQIINNRNVNIRNRDALFRHADGVLGTNFNEKIVNPFGYERSMKSLVQSGDFAKSSLKEYKELAGMPESFRRYPMLANIYDKFQTAKYHLDLYPKGIGEGKNYRYQNITNAGLKKTDTILVRGIRDKNKKLSSAKYAASHVNDMLTQYLLHPIDTFMEAPFELLFANANKIDDMAEGLSKSDNFVKNIAGKALSVINRPHLGLGYNRMKFGAPQYIAEFGLKRILPAYIALNLFDLGDKALGKAAGTSDVGLLRGGSNWLYQQASLGYSKLSDMTGMTDWAKWQNDIAPGSTGIGIFAGAMSAVATYKTGEYLYKKGPSQFRHFIDTAFNKDLSGGNVVQKWVRNNITKNKWVKDALSTEIRPVEGAASSAAQRLFKWSVKNPSKAIFAAAMIPMIPLIPGFIGSDKSYSEKKAEFKGQKEVAVRKFRGWILSSSPFEGDKVNQFRHHASSLMSDNWEDKVIWPSFKDKILHKLTFGLYKPNILEEYHKESQPVYKASSAIENVPLIGPPLAAISNMLFPQKEYHKVAEETIKGAGGYPALSSGSIGGINQSTGEIDAVAAGFADKGIHYTGGGNHLLSKFLEQVSEMAGLKGFTLQTLAGKVTGKERPDQDTPKLETSAKLYNPAYKLWGYQAGDITGVAGEFLRRIYQNPNKEGWTVNEIPNELAKADWIPHEDGYKNFTKGTTFDKMPMGWLYAARKGWEHLFPSEKGKELNSYSDPVKLEILQQIAPYSREFSKTSTNVMSMAIGNKLTPAQEQKYYETLDEVRQVKEQIWAHAQDETYELDLEEITGVVSQVNLNTGEFGIEGSDKKYKLAGVSIAEADIRQNLLRQKKYEDTKQLASDMLAIKEQTAQIIKDRLTPGKEVSFNVASAKNLGGNEALVGDLQEELLEAGAPIVDTGNLSRFNMNQARKGVGSKGLAKYWDALTDENTFFNKKLISDRDYLSQYLGEQVFSKQVRLWSRPIEHMLKPMIAQTLHRFGIDKIPSFTENRRSKQEYWDKVKYIKYKHLEEQANKEGDKESAKKYYNLWRQTMIGADPTDNFRRDELLAIPKNERAYFNFFTNEPDPEKRAEILKYTPDATKRLYYSIWAKKIAESSDNPEDKALFNKLKEGEGYLLTEKEEELYKEQTDGTVSKGDWARAQLVANFAKDNPLPGSDWEGWSANVDLENVEILSLQDEGEQIQDYGFFENKMRQAMYDDTASKAAIILDSLSSTPPSFTGEMIPSLMHVKGFRSLPTGASKSTSELVIETNDYNKRLAKQNDQYLEMLDDRFIQE